MILAPNHQQLLNGSDLVGSIQFTVSSSLNNKNKIFFFKKMQKLIFE